MPTFDIQKSFYNYLLPLIVVLLISTTVSSAMDGQKKKSPLLVPVQVTAAEKKMVSNQISLVGTTEAIEESIIASEVSGVVENFPVKAGDFVKKGQLLVNLRSTELKLRLKGAIAARGKIRANLKNAEKELKRVSRLKETNSIAEKQYDTAFYDYHALSQGLLQSEAEIDLLNYRIKQTEVLSPFSGFVGKEHTQVGEWINAGGPVVTLLNLSQIRINVDVPERYLFSLSTKSDVSVIIKSVSNLPFLGKIHAILPQGDLAARTFPVRIYLANPDLKIKSGMEARVTFNLADQKSALVIPKDAVVTAGDNRIVFSVIGGKAVLLNVKILGYYKGNVAVQGPLNPGDLVVIRGNERLRPGQAVTVMK